MMSLGHYILAADGQTPVPVADVMEWARMFGDTERRRVAHDILSDKVRVSTVFLGLDHSWGGGPPLLWETMIFGGPHDEYQERYSTYADAVAGHARALALARGETAP